MGDYQASTTVAMPADDVFDFVSSPENIPRYLDTVDVVQPLEDGHVEIAGESFRAKGWLEVDSHHLMMRWGSDESFAYAGHMTVTPMDDRSCKVEIHLLFAGDHEPARGTRILEGLDESLACIKSICEQSLFMPNPLQKRYMA
jgi:hypothetical protein